MPTTQMPDAMHQLPAPGQLWALICSDPAQHEDSLVALTHSAGQAARQVIVSSLTAAQQFYEQQLRQDDTDFLDRADTGTTGLALLLQSGASPAQCHRAAERCGISDLLSRGYRVLSTGESRLLLLLADVLRRPEVLFILEPFDGLDADRRACTLALLQEFLQDGGRVVLWAHRPEDIPESADRILVVQADGATLPFERSERLECLHLVDMLQNSETGQTINLPPPPPNAVQPTDPLVHLINGSVTYLDENQVAFRQFDGFTWLLRPGEHTLIVGPNGAGKSTVLQLISGDHPQCYGNELHLFGHRRGSGESIWDIKRNIGLVSPSLHRDYRAAGNLLSVVASGLYDTIGVYRAIPVADTRLAQQWLDVVGLRHRATEPFGSLSFSQQRLVLIARGLIKYPPLLILDEPTAGLDERGRRLLLAFLPRLAQLSRTTLLMVTHRVDEHLELFQHHLRFEPTDEPATRYRVRVSRDSSAADGPSNPSIDRKGPQALPGARRRR